MWFSGILLAAVITSAAATAIPGYGTYLEDLFSKDTDPSFARMAAEYGATFQKTNTETTACGDKCVVDFGDEKHLLYLNEKVKDPEDPCLIYTCTANGVTTENVKAACTPIDQIVCENEGRPVRLPDRCCATNCSTGTTGPDDEFSEWSEFTPCSRSCGKGFSASRRECKIVNGLVVNCVGEKIMVEECNLGSCPVNCTWTWSEFSPCSATCGTGTRTRTRIILTPADRGFCPPVETETIECVGGEEGRVCIVDGQAVCDKDKDCIIAPQDNCEDVENEDQADEDGDGVGDACDNCIYRKNPDQRNDDGDKTGNECDEDDDNDGKVDTQDNCGTIYNSNQRDRDQDGIGDCCDDCTVVDGECRTMATLTGSGTLDSDGDGIKDQCDSCPDIPNKNQTYRPCESMFAQSLNTEKNGLAAELMQKLMEMYYGN